MEINYAFYRPILGKSVKTTGNEAPVAVLDPNGSGLFFGLHDKHDYFGVLEIAGWVRNSIGLFALNNYASHSYRRK